MEFRWVFLNCKYYFNFISIFEFFIIYLIFVIELKINNEMFVILLNFYILILDLD